MAKTRYIALLRGINVGGKNLIKMDQLRYCLEDAGFMNAATYIASGNVLFDSADNLNKVELRIDESLEKRFGYRGPTIVVSAMDFVRIVNEAPDQFGTEPDMYHSDVIFLKHPVTAKKALEDVLSLNIKDGVDTAHAGSKALYFTRLSAKRTSSRMRRITELVSYKSMTIRSWNTVENLEALLAAE